MSLLFVNNAYCMKFAKCTDLVKYKNKIAFSNLNKPSEFINYLELLRLIEMMLIEKAFSSIQWL